jgi:serine/threonine protein kinase
MVDRAPLERVQSLEILLELCDIVRAAHAAGVVHRDLKLDNVFVCDRPFAGERRVKLLDWGVAHVVGEDDPFRGLIAGTLVYVAPEQMRGEPITPAADIYSLGVLAYRLLCHRPPFHSPSDLALIAMHMRAEPPRASVAWPGIPEALDALLCQMLAKRAEDRPTLDEVEAGLRSALASLKPQPREDRPTSRLRTRNEMQERLVAPDPFGRGTLPVPPLRAGWVGLAVSLAGLAGLLHALPF